MMTSLDDVGSKQEGINLIIEILKNRDHLNNASAFACVEECQIALLDLKHKGWNYEEAKKIVKGFLDLEEDYMDFLV